MKTKKQLKIKDKNLWKWILVILIFLVIGIVISSFFGIGDILSPPQLPS